MAKSAKRSTTPPSEESKKAPEPLRRRLSDEEILEIARKKAEESREMAQQLADNLNENVLKALKNPKT